jgi:hypothetical protein
MKKKMNIDKWTPKGKPRDGYYYDCNCLRCGNIQGAFIRGVNVFICPNCNNDKGVKLVEKYVRTK